MLSNIHTFCSEIAAEELDRDLTDIEIAELDQEELTAVQEAAEARIAVSPLEQQKEEAQESDEDVEKDALSLEDGKIKIFV